MKYQTNSVYCRWMETTGPVTSSTWMKNYDRAMTRSITGVIASTRANFFLLNSQRMPDAIEDGPRMSDI